ncbi:hypothetical protein BDP27DRAFT_1424445 [Rhodocollybia butyracea]|uniref:Uncharacterized protein n=1 Tax=Rhodocollybia butyracea TaxID=206335 RepID=A0A9P5PPW7_9AGAR|nr:hypothetical protein BDP27DRAFT_1424445 [Rhodocollybia butyracea]
MPSFTSLPTELTTKILQIYVACYIDPSFDITRVPLNDSSALELQHLSNQKELLSMLTVCRTFAAMLPPLIFQRPTIYIDATSKQALTNALSENQQVFESISLDTILVLENAHASLALEDHFLGCLRCPIVVTSTDSTVSNLASSFAHAFQLPTKATNNSRIISLVASGGTGKTQTVSKFIQDKSSRFSNIWFFDATSKETLTSDFKELAKAGGVGNQIKDVRNFLARTHQNWMCIFDSADDEQLYLKDYLPICTHGNIIITSRLVGTSEMDSPGCHIGFFDLNKDDAIELLLKHAHEESHEETQNVASEIVEALGCQALAVSTAGAYIHANVTCTLGNYLTHLVMCRLRLRAVEPPKPAVFEPSLAQPS